MLSTMKRKIRTGQLDGDMNRDLGCIDDEDGRFGFGFLWLSVGFGKVMIRRWKETWQAVTKLFTTDTTPHGKQVSRLHKRQERMVWLGAFTNFAMSFRAVMTRG